MPAIYLRQTPELAGISGHKMPEMPADAGVCDLETRRYPHRCHYAGGANMIVIIVGMYRSGSTFTLNIAREILEGAVDVLSANSVTAAELVRAQERHLVVKSHLPNDALVEMINSGQAVCIRTHRKPEEAVASWMDTFGYSFDDSIKEIRSWLQQHHAVHCDALNIPYEMIEDRPLKAIYQ
jgi:hypothetical protein